MKYQNGLFEYQGRINRLTFILQNIFWNTLGIPFIYYPLLITYLDFDPKYANLFLIIRWFFYIPLRSIDLRRIRDIVDRELSLTETIVIIITFSIPYVDFITSVFLSTIRPFKYAKSKFEGEIRHHDLTEAQIEEKKLMNQKLFKNGKISRAAYLATLEEIKKETKKR